MRRGVVPLVRRLPRVGLFCGLLAVLTLEIGCKGNDPVAVAPTYTRSTAVEFAVRNGSTIDPTGSPGIFDLSQDQAMLEFALDFPATNHVEVDFGVHDLIVYAGDLAGTFKVATYAGDGMANTGDYNAGTYFDLLALDVGELKNFTIDVTDAVAALRNGGATHIGLRFYASTMGQLNVQPDAKLVAGP